MKKRILALVLTLALLAVGMVFAVSATEAGDTTTTTYTGIEAEKCPCGCDLLIGDILTQGTLLTTSSTGGGHFYANGADEARGFGSTMNFMTSNTTTVIYLKNTSWGKTSAIKTAATDTTAAVYYNMRTMTIGYESTGVKVYIIGNNGVLTGAGMDAGTGTTKQNGGLVYLYSGSELHLMGDLEVKLASNTPNKPQSGGLIYSGGGAITVEDDVVMTGATVKASGGAIYTTGNLTVQDNAVIQNGVAPSYGGNVYAGGSNMYLKNNAKITGGKANQGGNVYLPASKNLTMSGGEISNGEATNNGAVQNAAFDDMNQGGGNIWGSRNAAVKISAGEVKDGKALTSGGGNIGLRGNLTLSGTGKLTGGTALQGGNVYLYDNNASGTMHGKLTMSGGTIDGGTATAGNGGAVYAQGSNSSSSTVGAGISITGGTIKNGIATRVGTTTGEGETATTTYSGGLGGNLYFANTKVTISGTNTSIEGGQGYQGGNIYATNALTVSGGTIKGGAATNAGGNVYITNASEVLFTLSAGTIQDGVAGEFTIDEETKKVTATVTEGEGGNIYTSSKAKLTMTGGTVKDGKAYYGGNIRNNTNISTSSYTTISGGTISGGEALRGGNIYSNRRMTVEGDTSIENGKALHAYRKADSTLSAFGGNWMVWSNNQTLKGSATVTDGYSDAYGGNIAAGVGGNNTVIFNLSGSAVVSGGEADKIAGNIYAGDTNASSSFNMSGGTVKEGTAPAEDNVKTDNIAVYSMPMNFTGGSVENTYEASNAGSAILISGDKLTVGGNAKANYRHTHNIYLSGTSSSLYVKADFKGEIWIFTWGRVMPKAEGKAYGTEVNYKNVAGTTTAASTTFTGKVYMAASSEAEYDAGTGIVAGSANIGTTDAPAYELYFGGATVTTVVEDADDVIDWYATTADAIAAATGKDDRYVALYTEDDITVAEDQVVYINFRNKTVNVTNNGTVYGFDRNCSVSKDADSAVTVTGNACENTFVAPTGYRYVALVDGEGVTTFHRLDLEITAVSLRASTAEASLYYTANIKAGPALRTQLKGIGVAVTLKENTTDLSDFLYTNEAYKEDGKYNGALVKGIVGTNASVAARAEAPIYAMAYVIVGEGEGAFSIMSDDGINYSLKDVLDEVNGLYYTFTDAQKELYDDMLETDWFTSMNLALAEKVTEAPTTEPEEQV